MIFHVNLSSNEDVLIRTRVNRISKEVQSRRCNWIEHVLINGGFQALHDCNDMEAGGQKESGCPKTTCRRTVEKERNSLGWRSWNETKGVASDRMNWRECTAALMGQGLKRIDDDGDDRQERAVFKRDTFDQPAQSKCFDNN